MDGRSNQKNKALLSTSSGISVNGPLVSENSLFVLFFSRPMEWRIIMNHFNKCGLHFLLIPFTGSRRVFTHNPLSKTLAGLHHRSSLVE